MWSTPINILTTIQSCLVNYARFSGRASRSQYWGFTLCLCLILFVAKWLDHALFAKDLPLLGTLVWVGAVLPYFSVAVRRLHDINRGGWWLLMDLVPMIGPFALIVVNCLKGTAGPNRFGPDPLAGDSLAMDVSPS